MVPRAGRCSQILTGAEDHDAHCHYDMATVRQPTAMLQCWV